MFDDDLTGLLFLTGILLLLIGLLLFLKGEAVFLGDLDVFYLVTEAPPPMRMILIVIRILLLKIIPKCIIGNSTLDAR